MPGEGFNPIETVRKFLEESECSSQIRETTATIFTVADASAEWSGCRPGCVPPVGYPEQPPTLLDEDLFLYHTVWAAAGTDHAFFPVAPEELLRITGGTKADIKKD